MAGLGGLRWIVGEIEAVSTLNASNALATM
jgi:hypothetical protein